MSRSRSRSRSPRERSRHDSRSPPPRRERSRSREKSADQVMYSVVVSDLPGDVRESELERKFEKYGKVGDVFMPKDRYSGKNRGFAFVRFCDKRDQEDCVEGVKRDPIHFGGPDCRVDFAKQKPRPGTTDWDPERAARERRERSDRDRHGGGGRRRSRSRSPRGGRDNRGSRRRSPSPQYQRSRRSPSPYRSRR